MTASTGRHFGARIAAALVFAALTSGTASAATPGTLYFAPTYATPSLNVTAVTNWRAEQEPAGKPDRLQILTGASVPGPAATRPSGVLQARIAPGDDTQIRSEHKRRAEVLWNQRFFGEGETTWLSFQIYVPVQTSLTGPSGSWTDIFQWHGDDRTLSAGDPLSVPPVVLGIKSRTQHFIIDSGLSGVPDIDLGPVVRGTWQRITLGVHFSTTAGWLEGYLDGRSLAGRKVAPTLYRGQRVYAKEGLYESWNFGTAYDRTVYHSAIRIGTTQEIVTAS